MIRKLFCSENKWVRTLLPKTIIWNHLIMISFHSASGGRLQKKKYQSIALILHCFSYEQWQQCELLFTGKVSKPIKLNVIVKLMVEFYFSKSSNRDKWSMIMIGR